MFLVYDVGVDLFDLFNYVFVDVCGLGGSSGVLYWSGSFW